MDGVVSRSEWMGPGERFEIERDTVRFGQTTQLRWAKLARRNEVSIDGLQQRGDVLSAIICRFAKRTLPAKRDDFGPGERFARSKLAGAVNFCAGSVVNHDQFRLIEVQDFAKLFGDLEQVVVARGAPI